MKLLLMTSAVEGAARYGRSAYTPESVAGHADAIAEEILAHLEVTGLSAPADEQEAPSRSEELDSNDQGPASLHRDVREHLEAFAQELTRARVALGYAVGHAGGVARARWLLMMGNLMRFHPETLTWLLSRALLVCGCDMRDATRCSGGFDGSISEQHGWCRCEICHHVGKAGAR